MVKRDVKVDYLGAVLIEPASPTLLIWVTWAGNNFRLGSRACPSSSSPSASFSSRRRWSSSRRCQDPIIPLRLFRDRTTALATLASTVVGIAMFGGAVFLGQYFQIARGYSPTASGLLTLPMVAGSMISATVSGAMHHQVRLLEAVPVAGAVALTPGFFLLSTIDHQTPMFWVGLFLFVLGPGMGMMMQNLVLAVQNTVAPNDLGRKFDGRFLPLTRRRSRRVRPRRDALQSHCRAHGQGPQRNGDRTGASGRSGAGISNLNELPEAIADVVRASYGDALRASSSSRAFWLC